MKQDKRHEMIEFDMEYRHETDLAVLVDDGDDQYWLPKSQVQYDDGEYEKGDIMTVYIPFWLAEDEGLI